MVEYERSMHKTVVSIPGASATLVIHYEHFFYPITFTVTCLYTLSRGWCYGEFLQITDILSRSRVFTLSRPIKCLRSMRNVPGSIPGISRSIPLLVSKLSLFLCVLKIEEYTLLKYYQN